MTRFVRFVPLLALLLLPPLTSCGAAMPSPRSEPRQDPQRELDEQEARLRQAQQALEEAGAACEQRCRAGGSLCDAARRICDIAGELGDDRSHARCETAQASCTQANERLSACACEPDAPDAGRACNVPRSGWL